MSHHSFRAAVEARDHSALVDALSTDVVLHSPVTFKPFEGRDAVGTVLGAVMRVFEDFRYTDELPGDDSLALVFEARIGERDVQGVDLLRFDADGQVSDLTVLVRPLSGTLALRDAMARELGLVS
jgi:hypothetical protein